MALTLVPMLGVMLYRTILTAAERPKVFLKVTAAMLPLNALGNYVFMHGLGTDTRDFGTTGAGVSSLLVALLSLGVLVLVARRSVLVGGEVTPHPAIKSWRDLVPFLRVGLPIGIAMVTELGIFLAATLYAATLECRRCGGAYADPAGRGHRLCRSRRLCCRRAWYVWLALRRWQRSCRASGRRLRLARPVHWRWRGASCGACPRGAALALRRLRRVNHRYGSRWDGCRATAASRLMEVIVNPGAAAAGLLRGQKDTRAPMIFTLSGYWAVGAPLGLWLCEARDLGITGIWIGLAVGTATTTILMLARLSRTSALSRGTVGRAAV
jgi:multidrug resistance protein, MATE family